MDEPRGNWLKDPPDTPLARRTQRNSDPAQPNVENVIEHLQALEARTRELEAEVRRERAASPPSAPPEPREAPARQGDEITDRFTELARRAFSEEFEQLRQRADQQAKEIIARARAESERRAQEILGKARGEAERMSSAAREQAEAARAASAKSAAREKGLATQLRRLLAWIDETLEDLDARPSAEPGEGAPVGRTGDLIVIPSTDERSSPEAARAASVARDAAEEPGG